MSDGAMGIDAGIIRELCGRGVSFYRFGGLSLGGQPLTFLKKLSSLKHYEGLNQQ